MGTLLLQAVIEDCKRQGYKGIEGDLSEPDRDHFDKLKTWYPKNGFSVKVYEEKESKQSAAKRVGCGWSSTQCNSSTMLSCEDNAGFFSSLYFSRFIRLYTPGIV